MVFHIKLSTNYSKKLLADYQRMISERQRKATIAFSLLIIILIISAIISDVRPLVFINNISHFSNYIIKLFYLDSGKIVFSDPIEWFWGWRKWSLSLIETILMAYVGTLIAATFAFFLSFFASKNITKNMFIVMLTRRLLEFARTVPEIVYALIFVIAFGLGPVAGVLAIVVHTIGALGKLFAEVIENIDMKPFDGVLASGGNWLHCIRFGALPQIWSNLLSYTLLRFEINIRSAAVMGFVGAGGIGQLLLESIRKFYYSDVSAIIFMIIAFIMIFDVTTEWIRHKIIGSVIS